ncbi:MAG: hypothetical protein IKK68_02095 [Paludibacteraceae bacterium]|nr:hypothetical protein [Paludibacteraceae bacterium]
MSKKKLSNKAFIEKYKAIFNNDNDIVPLLYVAIAYFSFFSLTLIYGIIYSIVKHRLSEIDIFILILCTFLIIDALCIWGIKIGKEREREEKDRKRIRNE